MVNLKKLNLFSIFIIKNIIVLEIRTLDHRMECAYLAFTKRSPNSIIPLWKNHLCGQGIPKCGFIVTTHLAMFLGTFMAIVVKAFKWKQNLFSSQDHLPEMYFLFWYISSLSLSLSLSLSREEGTNKFLLEIASQWKWTRAIKDKAFCPSLPVWRDWAIYWTLGNFLKPLATINLPKSPTFLGNFFIKVSKAINFLVKSFLDNFYRHLATFFWSHWSLLSFSLVLLHSPCYPSLFFLFACRSVFLLPSIYHF